MPFVALASVVAALGAASPPPISPAQGANAYTRYELLAPGSAKFRIVYDVTETRAGAKAFFNPIRKGSVSTDEKVTDRMTGEALTFTVVHGADVPKAELPDAQADTDYIRVKLARPVPENGGAGRIRIEKTYQDARSYYTEGKEIVFDRTLYVKRDAVVLPKNYVLVSSNYPSQVEEEADGRIKVSFLNVTPADAPVKIRARPVKKLAAGASSVKERIEERAAQTRDIVYFLREPGTHAFDLCHDYTEERAGTSTYVNIVRPGSTASNPSARNLDTGAEIPAQALKGAAIKAAGIEDPDLKEITPETEVVVFRFAALAPGHSIRLRMAETYTDPGRYKLQGDELVFDRTFGRPANTVVLPAGWVLTNSAAPAIISETADGRTRLDFLNPRTDEVSVLITARKAR